MIDPMKDPGVWRKRAMATRAKADGYSVGEHEKKRLLKIAAEYDQLADRVEQFRVASEAEQQDIRLAQTIRPTT